MNWNEAFEMYIKGQIVVQDTNHQVSYSTFAEGVLMGNGYKFVSYGSGCSGEDCNSSYIISPDDKIIAKTDY